MERIPVPLMDKRLQERYVTMVQAHMRSARPLSAGVAGVRLEGHSFAATQAAWRFLNNDRITLPLLIEPLQEAGRHAVAADAASVGLLIHDWSKLDYARHSGKRDVLALTHDKDIGYELATALLVSASDGSPLAPMQMHLATGQGLLSTTPDAVALAHVDQVLATMNASRGWGLSKPLVHVVDREADSVDHYRQWDQASHRFLVRGDDRRVRWEDQSVLLSQVTQTLTDRGSFQRARSVQYRGKEAFQWVAQTMVTLDRPGRKRTPGGRRVVAGRPLEVRLVISRICDAQDRVLATWLLLTNVGQTEAEAATVALWYYWRWRIESFFKLLKGHGQQIEQWQQETGAAIAKRLLVASMACVVVWDLQRQESAEADQIRRVLVKLSGRQMKHGVSHTAPALLAGLMILLPMLELLKEHAGDLSHLFSLTKQTLPFIHTG